MNHKIQLKYNDIEEYNELELSNKISSNDSKYPNEISQKSLPSTILREAREKNGMSVKATAKKLFLETSMIRVLENDKYDELPDVFVRGYLRNYAKLQDIPQEDIMESFETMIDQKPTLSPIKPKLKPYLIPHLNNFESSDKNISLFVIGILTITILLMFLNWQFNQTANNDYQILEKIWSPENVTSQTIMTESDIIVPIVIPIQTVLKGIIPNEVEIPIKTSNIPNLKTVVKSDILLSNSQATKSLNTITTTPIEEIINQHQTLQVHFKEKAWISIFDQERKKLYQGIGNTGEILLLEGIPPFNIKVGNFSGVYIEYNDNISNIRSFPKYKLNKRTFVIG